MRPRAAELLTAPPTSAATSRHHHSPRKNGRSPRRSAAESLSSPYSSVRHRRLARQHVADKGHGEAALRGERGLIERIEQLIEKPHVARIAPPQPLPGLIRELQAAQARA